MSQVIVQLTMRILIWPQPTKPSDIGVSTNIPLLCCAYGTVPLLYHVGYNTLKITQHGCIG